MDRPNILDMGVTDPSEMYAPRSVTGFTHPARTVTRLHSGIHAPFTVS
jgi:hypothetical protein